MARKNRRKSEYGTGCVFEKPKGSGIYWIKRHVEGQEDPVYVGEELPNGKRRGFRNRADAELMNAKLNAGVVGITVPATPDNAPVLDVLFPEWSEKRQARTGPGRTAEVRSWRDDEYRWKNHLSPSFGQKRAADVGPDDVERLIDRLLLLVDKATVQRCVMLLSSFYNGYLVGPKKYTMHNPVAQLDPAARKKFRKKYDPATVPFVERAEDIRRILVALPSPYSVAYAVGAYAGLRNGEILGLMWIDINWERGYIHVQRQVSRNELGPLKNNKSRKVPIQTALWPILKAWKFRTGGQGLCFQPVDGKGGRPGRPAKYMTARALNDALKETLVELPDLLARAGDYEQTWYAFTRHTYASHQAMSGRSMQKLQQWMGHASIETTMRYAHLIPDQFTKEDINVFGEAVDLEAPRGKVTPIKGDET
jgi:integrase